MNPVRILLENRHAVWALVLAILFFGTAAYTGLPVQLFPDTDPPMVNVITAYPGASAPDVARDLSRPLEEEFASLEAIVSLESSSEDNLSVIELEFDYGRDAELAAIEAQNAIARIADELPAEIREPQVLSYDNSDGAAITLGIAGDELVEARRIADDEIAPRIQRVEGVAAVDVFGGRLEAVVVEAKRWRLAAHQISIQQLVDELSRQHAAGPAGMVHTDRHEMLFRVEARPENLQQLEATPITLADGTQISLGEVADVRSAHLDEEADFAIDGRTAVALEVFETTGANTVEVVRRVERLAAELDDELRLTHGGRLEMVVGEESATFTETSVDNLFSNVAQAILLAAVIIFLFLGRPRASLVAAVSMPLSYALTFAGMYAAGVEFNMVTLSAVILAVGMVVDASVVVIENIVRFREAKRPPMEAAAEGVADIGVAVVAGALTTTAVLVALLFVPGFVGATFGPLAATLLMAFLSSVVVALAVVPVLSLYLTSGQKGTEQGSKSQRTGLWSRRLTAPFRAVMDGLRGLYLRLLSAALRRRLVTLLVAVATFVVGIVGIKSAGMEVLPRMDGGSFYISFETPSGSSLETTNRVARQIEDELHRHDAVRKVQRQTGYETGMRSLSATGAQGPSQGFISVELSPRTERDETIWDIQRGVRRYVESIADVETSVVRELGNTARSTTDAPVGVRLIGSDPLVLDRLGDELIERLDSVDGVVSPVRNWRFDHRRQQVDVDALRAGRLGISAREVGLQMQAGSEGLEAGQFYGDRSTGVPILVRNQQRHTSDDLLAFPLTSATTEQNLPLRSVADVTEETGQAVVTRHNLIETLDITAQTGDRPLNFVMGDVEQAVGTLELPAGYEVAVTGERSEMDESRSELAQALGIAVIAVYLLLVAELRSFVRPLVIMMSVPLSLVGVSAALAITGRAVSMPVMVGLILLVGIVVNNAIILLDVVIRRQESGATRRQALIDAVDIRFRPVMMTSLSTVVGMVPLAGAWALGAERFSPLAIAVMGGMIASTLLTMVVIPVFYDVVESGVRRLENCR